MPIKSAAANSWCIVHPPTSTPAKALLFVFGPAGSSASAFRPWVGHLPESIAMVVIELPGRGKRANETALSDVETIAHQCVTKGLLPYLTLPFFLFGHSFGSLVAFEVARTLQRLYDLSPQRLFISSHITPMAPPRHMFELESDPESDKNLVKYIILTHKDDQLEQMAKSHPALLAELMPALRADAYANENYDYQEGNPLGCPISFFYGTEEEWVTETDIEDWKQQSSKEDEFELHCVPGAHRFVFDVDAFLPVLNRSLSL